jgi:hypothetical protein
VSVRCRDVRIVYGLKVDVCSQVPSVEGKVRQPNTQRTKGGDSQDLLCRLMREGQGLVAVG